MKKMSLLVAALLAVGATTATLTSCIDNNEPAGITTLRNAKAGLLNAMAEVQKADAEVKRATQELLNAQKKSEELRQQILLIQQETAELQKKYEQEKNNSDLEVLILENQQKMEKMIVEHEGNMANAQRITAEKVEALRVALAKIALANATMTTEQKTALENAQNAVTDAIKVMNDQMDKIAEAENAVITALTTDAKAMSVETAELTLETAEAEVVDAQAFLDLSTELYNSITSGSSQKAELEKLKKQVVLLEDSLALVDVEEAEVLNSTEVKSYVHRLNELGARDGSTDGLIKTEMAKNKVATSYAVSLKKETTDAAAELGLTSTVINLAYTKGVDTRLDLIISDPTKEKGYKAATASPFKSILANKFSSEAIALYKEIMSGNGASITTAENNYKDAKAAWETALAKYNSASVLVNNVAAGQTAVKTANETLAGTATTDGVVKEQLDKITAYTTLGKTTYATQINSAYNAIGQAVLDYWDALANVGGKVDETLPNVKLKLVKDPEKIKLASDGTIAYGSTEMTIKDWLKTRAQVIFNGVSIKEGDVSTTYYLQLSGNDFKLTNNQIVDFAKKPQAFNVGVNVQTYTIDGTEYTITDPTKVVAILKKNLIDDSANAFGTRFLVDNEQYMRVVPTDAEIAAKTYLSTDIDKLALWQFALNGANKIAKNWETIKADLEAADKAYNDYVETVIDEQVANDKAVKALQSEFDSVTKKKNAALKVVSDKKTHLTNKLAYATGILFNLQNASNPEAELKEAVAEAKAALIEAQGIVEAAKIDLEAIKNGTYTQAQAIESKERELALAKAKYEKYVSRYEQAVANLEAITKAITGEE